MDRWDKEYQELVQRVASYLDRIFYPDVSTATPPKIGGPYVSIYKNGSFTYVPYTPTYSVLGVAVHYDTESRVYSVLHRASGLVIGPLKTLDKQQAIRLAIDVATFGLFQCEFNELDLETAKKAAYEVAEIHGLVR